MIKTIDKVPLGTGISHMHGSMAAAEQQQRTPPSIAYTIILQCQQQELPAHI
jgi:hypothetical protein